MRDLLAALDAFLQEHRRCGELDGGLDGSAVWMACDCDVHIVPEVRGGDVSESGEPALSP
jgi:hypothetical protein